MSTAAPIKYFFANLLMDNDPLAVALNVRHNSSLTSGTITGFQCMVKDSAVPALVHYTGKTALDPVEGKVYECTGEGEFTPRVIANYKIGNHYSYELQDVEITLEDESKVGGKTFVWVGEDDRLSAVIPAAKTAGTQSTA